MLGQHVGPFAAGMVAVHAGPSFAAADALRIVLYGRGGTAHVRRRRWIPS